MAIFKELPVLNPQAPGLGPELLERPLSPSKAAEVVSLRKPEWVKIRPPGGPSYRHIKELLQQNKLHTVCEEARCPNLTECWAGGTATFMLGGDVCTRACRFCAVKTARRPAPLDAEEPKKIASSIVNMGLKYIVLTSVDRDDLEDQMSGHFAETITEIKRQDPQILVEALVPDFRGDIDCVRRIVDSGVDVYAHNIETVKRLQYRVRDPRATYGQSLGTLREAKRYAQAKKLPLYTKSSIMLGLGENDLELAEAFDDLRAFDVDVLTLGQYLRPTAKHLPVERFVAPAEFKDLEALALQKNFLYVAAGPMVRSSYKAAEFFMEGVIRKRAAEKGE